MIARKPIYALALALFAGLSLSSCASLDTCKGGACSADAGITASVKSELADHVELRDIGVQTIEGVVYLRGLVDTNVEREEAESAARRVTGVTSVVNTITVRNAGQG
jgi:osmotically-inducible protein OsmY